MCQLLFDAAFPPVCTRTKTPFSATVRSTRCTRVLQQDIMLSCPNDDSRVGASKRDELASALVDAVISEYSPNDNDNSL
jgi:hypothetical protein